MKKILVLTHEYYPFVGGIATYCFELFQKLSQSDYDVLTDQAEVEEGSNASYFPFLWKYVRPRWFRAVLTVPAVLRKKHSQVIFTPHVLPLGLVAYYIKKLRGIPYIISLHGVDLTLAKKNRPRALKKVLCSAQHIIVNSQFMKNALPHYVNDDKITVMTPYFNPERLKVNTDLLKILRQKYQDNRVIITVGRLVRRKGQDMMIRAISLLKDSVDDIQYLIIGDGPDENYLRQLIHENGVEAQVKLIGAKTLGDLAAYYAVADVFALPARTDGTDYESFGIVYLEAIYFGLPVIAGASGGVLEAIGGNVSAYIVDGTNVEDLMNAIRQSLETESANKKVAKAQQYLKTLPHWDDHALTLKMLLS